MRFFTKTTVFLAVAVMVIFAFSSSAQASDAQLAPRAQGNEVGPRSLVISTFERLAKKANDIFGQQGEHVIVAKDVKAGAPRAEHEATLNVFPRNEAAIGSGNTRIHARDLGKRAGAAGVSLRSNEMLFNLRAKGDFCGCCSSSPAELCCGYNPNCSCSGCHGTAEMEEKDIAQLRAFAEDYDKRVGRAGEETAA